MNENSRESTERAASPTLEIAKQEYALLADARRTSFEGAGRRFEHYLLIVSITGIAIGTVASADIGQAEKNALLGILSLNATAIGLATFGRLVELHLNGILYTRGLNGLRGWFLVHAPELKEVFTLPTSGASPSYLSPRIFVSKAELVSVVNATILGAIAGLSSDAAFNSPRFGLACAGAWLLQNVYLVCRSLAKDRTERST